MKSYGEKLKIGERKGKMLQKTKVREVFNKYKVQLPTETLNFLDSEISKMIEKWAIRCKNSNIKRLSLNLVGYIGLIMNRDKK
jgi:hypothetical protein|tara:strand:- start:114 stop:362 length:249 start_codon:yes stop_codon:yes gene_type:complete